jgi:hypothetical protein
MKKRKSPGDRLILMVAKHRENATLRKLAHSRMSGTLLEQAKAETAGLVVFEPIYHNGRRSRSQAARLTQRGIWQAIRLTRGYDPALAAAALATTDIKAVLARLEAEGNPLAVEIADDRADAAAWRAQEKRSKVLERAQWELVEKVRDILALPPSRVNPRKRAKLNEFLASLGLKPAAPALAAPLPGLTLRIPPAGKIPSRTDVAPQAIGRSASHRPAQAPKEVCSFCAGFPKSEVQPHDCNLYMVPVDCAHWLRTGQTVRTRQGNVPDPRVAIITRANIAGYPTRAGREVMIESKWVSAEEWNRLVPEN